MASLFWLSDEAWAAIEPHLPRNQPGARRVDDRRVISGIFHVLKSGCRWVDCPPGYGPATTVYNRFNRWSRRGFWVGLLEALADAGAVTKSTAIDSTYIKAQRSAFGGKGGPQASDRALARRPHDQGPRAYRRHRPPLRADADGSERRRHHRRAGAAQRAGPMRYLLGDKGYDADALRRSLRQAGTVPVIPGRANRKRAVRYNRDLYRDRRLIENAFCRLKDFRRISTRYDKLAANFLSGVALATALAFWL